MMCELCKVERGKFKRHVDKQTAVYRIHFIENNTVYCWKTVEQTSLIPNNACLLSEVTTMPLESNARQQRRSRLNCIGFFHCWRSGPPTTMRLSPLEVHFV